MRTISFLAIFVVLTSCCKLCGQVPEVVASTFTIADLLHCRKLPHPKPTEGESSGHDLSRLKYIAGSGWVVGTIDSFTYDPDLKSKAYAFVNPSKTKNEQSSRVIAINLENGKIFQLQVLSYNISIAFEFVKVFQIDKSRMGVVVSQVEDDLIRDGVRDPFERPMSKRTPAGIWVWDLNTQVVKRTDQSRKQLDTADLVDSNLFTVESISSDEQEDEVRISDFDSRILFRQQLESQHKLISTQDRSKIVVVDSNKDSSEFGCTCFDLKLGGKVAWKFGVEQILDGDGRTVVSLRMPNDAQYRKWKTIPLMVGVRQLGKRVDEYLVLLDVVTGKEAIRNHIIDAGIIFRFFSSENERWVALILENKARIVNTKTGKQFDCSLEWSVSVKGILNDGSLVLSDSNQRIWIGSPFDGTVERQLFELLPDFPRLRKQEAKN